MSGHIFGSENVGTWEEGGGWALLALVGGGQGHRETPHSEQAAPTSKTYLVQTDDAEVEKPSPRE